MNRIKTSVSILTMLLPLSYTMYDFIVDLENIQSLTRTSKFNLFFAKNPVKADVQTHKNDIIFEYASVYHQSINIFLHTIYLLIKKTFCSVIFYVKADTIHCFNIS